jgi:hypothetical protein
MAFFLVHPEPVEGFDERKEARITIQLPLWFDRLTMNG